MTDRIKWYDDHARELSCLYEGVEAANLHAWLISALPEAPTIALDVGCGSGRDADWLASRGIEVVAVDPSQQMLAEAQRLHASPTIRWIKDSLPSLDRVFRLGLSFDLILLSAVWMHVPPAERARSFRKLVTLMTPGGCLAVTLRHGPSGTGSSLRPRVVSAGRDRASGRAHGAFVEVASRRARISSVVPTSRGLKPQAAAGRWNRRTPKLLRHIILNDNKSSTYKLALLRVLCRIADGAAGYARYTDEGDVAVPLGLLARIARRRLANVA